MNQLSYDPVFDVIMDCLSSGDDEIKSQLEKYVSHRHKFGREAARRIYPQCYYIQIADPELAKIWKQLLNTVDKL